MKGIVQLRRARDPRAVPVLFLHGLLGAAEFWSELAALLSYPGALGAVTLPGHGLPPSPAVQSFEEAVDALPLERGSFVVGYSMGGRLALGLAARRPRDVRGVVAVGAHAGIADAAERERRIEWERKERALLESRGLDAFVDHWDTLPVFATQADLLARPLSRARLARQRAMRLGHDVGAVAQAFTALGSGHMPLLPKARVPTLLVAGERDERFAPAAHRCIPGVGHNVVLEAPDAFARLLDRQLVEWSGTTLETHA
jgi:2-succinyl-6-hydroxy-2,4-cyclohexadiene-1-carboxylate synthase